ncbi:O-methyltransferase [Macleaya cordata]|uniref:O-methyltransferase n=1 Tax=Macleaya cordata TaxID=56857 RepID=A0A200PP72_MACCD|nr:O-methyltransferase [Macleaya cordata]
MESTTQEVKDNELIQAQTHVFNHIFSFVSSMSLKCAVQLGIPEIIHNHGQPITLSSLVEALSLPPTKSYSIYRLMRLLVHSGFFACQKIDENQQEEGFLLTPSSRLLLKDNTKNLSSFLLNMLDPVLITPWHFLSAWFQGNGSTAFEAAHDMTLWNFLEQYPEFNKNFNDAMASDSGFVMSVIVNDCKAVFENLRSLVDVGGGTGSVAQALAKAFPHLNCLVFDLPNVVANLPGSKNLNYIGGDMFESIPCADAVFMKFVLHAWSDSDCIKILKRCREAIPSREEGGKVIIIEIVMEENRKQEDKSTETQLFFDMLMMTVVTGKERTEKEWKKLFLESGFSDYKMTPVLGFRSLIEYVLHDWSDKDCVKILKRCREAIPCREEGGKVIIIEIVLEDRKQEHETTETQFFFDIQMMVFNGGKERSEREWKELFLESGFTEYKITPLPGFRSLIEVYP